MFTAPWLRNSNGSTVAADVYAPVSLLAFAGAGWLAAVYLLWSA
jgi:hypothetical protein